MFILPGQAGCFLIVFLFYVLGILGIYFLGRKISSDFAGLFAALILAFHPLNLLVGNKILTDGPSMVMFIFLALSLLNVYEIRSVKSDITVGIIASLIMLMKWTGFGGDFRKIAQACDGVKDENNKRICYDNLARQIHPVTAGDSAKAIELCKSATGIWQDQCLITIVNAEFSVGGKRSPVSYAMCPAVKDSGKITECYNVLLANISTYGQTSAERRELCGLVKSDAWKAECLKRY
jgi:hypothetical protein